MSDTREPTSGHGHVFRSADGAKAGCGGPGLCQACDADLARLAAATKRSGTGDGLEDEIQGMCDRALADTRWP